MVTVNVGELGKAWHWPRVNLNSQASPPLEWFKTFFAGFLTLILIEWLVSRAWKQIVPGPAHCAFLAPKAVDRPFINGAQSQRPNGRRRDREMEGGRRQTAEGFSILKPFFPIAAASKLREEKRSVRMGSLNFPAYPWTLSPLNIMKGGRGGWCEMAASARD